MSSWRSCSGSTSATRPGVSEAAAAGAGSTAWPGRVMGLDYGARTVGVAMTDPLRKSVRGLEIIRRKDENHLRATYRRLLELCEHYEVREIVLGLPLNMDGRYGERAEKTLRFGEALTERLGLPVHMTDERLTTVEAEEAMRLRGIRRSDFKHYVDQIAAAIILEDWLNQYGNH